MAQGSWSRILVIRLSSLGDVARMLPALAVLKADPARVVDVTVEDRFAGLLSLFPIADRVVPYPRKVPGPVSRHPFAWSKAFASYLGSLREGRYDLALDLHGILRSALLARLSGAAECVGYARGFGREGSHLLYDRAVKPSSSPHISRYERYAGTVEALGFPRPGEAHLQPRIPPEARASVAEFLEAEGLSGRPYVVVFIGTSRAQAFKRWPLARFLELARLLWRERGVPTVLGWGPDEAEEVRTLQKADYVHVAPDWPLAPLVCAIGGAAAFVGADTGAMHIAALIGTPTVVLFGPTDPVLNAPFGSRTRVVIREGAREPCAGASCDHAACLGALRAEEALVALQELLDEGGASGRQPSHD